MVAMIAMTAMISINAFRVVSSGYSTIVILSLLQSLPKNCFSLFGAKFLSALFMISCVCPSYVNKI